MANLVSPGYDRSALISEMLHPYEERTLEFLGLNRKSHIDEGEMSDMINLTSDKYPYLTQRKQRGHMDLPQDVIQPLNIIPKFDKIAMIAKKSDDSIAFFYGGTEVSEVTGLSEGAHMVAINTKICFFPEKKYVQVVKSGSGASIVSGSFKSLEETKSVSQAAVTNSTSDVKITVSGNQFVAGDAVTFSGSLSYTSGGTSKSATVNVSCPINAVNGNVLTLPNNTFIEATGAGASSITFTGTISRTVPDLDHVVEWNNRLWGASNDDNTVYACKLGDPTNWQYYQGTSIDSYYAQQGTDENWTGVGVYSGHIIFFKPSSMCRIYGTSPANYQVTNTQCFGVEDGSRQSVVTINDRVYYKSKIGIMAYDGGTPYCISDKFNAVFKDVVSGTEGIKYYASIRGDYGNELMVLDVDRAVWHREDNVRFRNCCTMNNRLYFIEYESELLYCGEEIFCSDDLLVGSNSVDGSVGIINPQKEVKDSGDIDWMATFGPFDEYIENRKIYSKISLRLNVYANTSLNVYISLNEGEWELVEHYEAAETGGHIIPIVPRRCDRYSIKLEGTGYCEVKALTRRVRAGTHGKL